MKTIIRTNHGPCEVEKKTRFAGPFILFLVCSGGFILLLILFCWVFVADGNDVDARNAYMESLDSAFIEKEFAEKGVVYYDETGWNTGVYSSVSFYVDRECSIPESILEYMEQHQLGYIMWVHLMQGTPGTGKKIETKIFF